MVVPVGRQVKLIITGADVIHSFAVPAFWTKMDAVPGRANETTFTANKVGVYYGQCSELCGVDHGYMPIAVEVLPVEKWEAWVRSKGGNPAGIEAAPAAAAPRSEEHTSELQSLMRISYAVFCLKKKKQERNQPTVK